MSLADISFGMVRKCDENAHDARKALIDKYVLSDEKQESLNEVTNMWNNYNIKDTIIDPDIWFNELYNSNPQFNNINENYEKYEDELKAHVFDVLTKEYTQVRVSCNINIENMDFKDTKKEIRSFCTTELNGLKKQEKE